MSQYGYGTAAINTQPQTINMPQPTNGIAGQTQPQLAPTNRTPKRPGSLEVNDPRDSYNSLYGNTAGQGGANGWQFPFGPPQRHNTLNPDGTLMDPFKLDVTSRRPESPWLKMQLQREGQQYDNFRGQALRDNQAGMAGAQNNLAATGGLSSGARERVQTSGNRGLANSYTGLANQSSQNRLGLRTQDFTNQVNADKWNIGNNFGQIDAQAGFDANVFDTKAKAWGASQVAGAMGAGQGGGGSGWLGQQFDQFGNLIMAPFEILNPNNY